MSSLARTRQAHFGSKRNSTQGICREMKGGRKSEITLQREPHGFSLQEISLDNFRTFCSALVRLLAIVALRPIRGGSTSSPAAAMRADQTSMYQMILVDRTVKAVKYAHRSGSTKINFEGTDLMARRQGRSQGATAIAEPWKSKSSFRICRNPRRLAGSI